MSARFTDEDVTFKKEKKLGCGTYGTVEKIELTMEGEKKFYALKRNFIQGKDHFTESSRELDILNALRHHPLIISLKLVKLGNPYGKEEIPIVNGKSFDDMRNDYLHFIFECGIMNLAKWNDRNSSCFGEVKQFMADMLLATEYISNSGYIHRDLKPGNIVIFPPTKFLETPGKDFTSDSRASSPLETPSVYHRAKIIDFGLAKPVVTDGLNTPGVVTYYYRAPEIINKLDYSDKIDTWSLGCIFYEMIMKEHFIKTIHKETDKNLQIAIMKNAVYDYEPHEIRDILGYKGKMKPKVVPMRDRLRNLQNFATWCTGVKTPTEKQKKDAERAMGDVAQVLEGMLKIDPEKRFSASEALELQFFDDRRSYITEMRKKYKPISTYEHEYLIPVCQERKYMSSLVIFTYNSKNKNEWYQHRRLFHAIDLFDKVLRHFLRKEKSKESNVWTEEETKKYFYACLFYSVKYFATLESAWDLLEVLPKDFRSKEIVDDICEKANYILEHVLEFKFYRHTLYEAICEQIQPSEKRFEYVIKDAILTLTTKTDQIKGKTPSILCKQLMEKGNTK